MEPLRDLVHQVERLTVAHRHEKADDRRAAHPHVAMRRPYAHLLLQRWILHEQRAYDHPAHRIRRRPVRRIVFRQPALAVRQHARREVFAIARDDLEADGLRLEKPIGHQGVGKRDGVVHVPPIAMRRMDRSRQLAHGGGADVVKSEVSLATKVPAGVEVAGGTREPLDRALRLSRGGRYSFLRTKHFR